MSCAEAAARYRQRLLDIAETKTGKKILESMKNISKSKGSDYLMKHEEVSKESGIKDSRVESILDKFSEVGIVIRKPVYAGVESSRRVDHYEYRMPGVGVKGASIVFIDLNNQKESDDSEARRYIV